MSRDRGTAKKKVDQGYGLVRDQDGHPIPDLIMSQANQEHGIVEHRHDSSLTPMLPIGTLLRILPNHACSTAAQHDRYIVVAGSQKRSEERRVGKECVSKGSYRVQAEHKKKKKKTTNKQPE